MANLQSLNINDTGFLQLSSGTIAQRAGSPTTGSVRYNNEVKVPEFYSGTKWECPVRSGLGSSSTDPAKSGYHLAQTRPGIPSGTYWIKSDFMPSALQMYVDMTYEGGGYDFYNISAGTSINYITDTHSGKALGLDLVYPRSKQHWYAMSAYVRNVIGSTDGSYFQVPGPVTRTTSGTGAGSSSGNYTGQIFRDARYYGSGTYDWQVPDGGRWWLRDNSFGEPNGDYTANAFLGLYSGGYTIANPYAGADIGFNDGTAAYTTGTKYLVSTNAKP
jgi:hypothetical protein